MIEVHRNFSEAHLTLLEPQSRFGGKPVKFQIVCPQNGTAVLEGLRSSIPHPKTGFSKNQIASRWTIAWLNHTQNCFSKQHWHSDDFGLRSPVIQKQNQRKCATSIVERVASTSTKQTSSCEDIEHKVAHPPSSWSTLHSGALCLKNHSVKSFFFSSLFQTSGWWWSLLRCYIRITGGHSK